MTRIVTTGIIVGLLLIGALAVFYYTAFLKGDELSSIAQQKQVYSYKKCEQISSSIGPREGTIKLPDGFEETQVAGGFELPTSMAFAPDGRLFVTERFGKVRVVKDRTLLPIPFLTVSVDATDIRGLHGIAFDPDFTDNGYVYIAYTRAYPPSKNRLSRFTASESNSDVADPNSEVILIDDVPAGHHNGGALAFGPDGYLYYATGEADNLPAVQSPESLEGKVLRIDPSSYPNIIPSDNPFLDIPNARDEIWALGFRNPFTSAFDPATGIFFVNDVGAKEWEEVNRVVGGGNYGASVCEGFCSEPGYEDPIYAYPYCENSAIIGGAFYRADQFPSEYRDTYFFTDYNRGFIRAFRIGERVEVIDFAENAAHPVSLRVGPDGSLYYLAFTAFSKDFGKNALYKIRYAGSGNYSPKVAASAKPQLGPSPLRVVFSAEGSSDPDGDTLRYVWDFGDGSEPQEGLTVTHTYKEDGVFHVTLTVDDYKDGFNSAIIDMRVGTPPSPIITSPSEGTLYRAGETIYLSAKAPDAEEGVLPASSFYWIVSLHWDDRDDIVVASVHGKKEWPFEIPQRGRADAEAVYRMKLRVTDSSGLKEGVARDLLPQKSTFAITTDPRGLEISLDGKPRAAPLGVSGVVGFIRTLQAPQRQTLNEAVYEFEFWSDGGEALHEIETPSQHTIYTATYKRKVSQ